MSKDKSLNQHGVPSNGAVILRVECEVKNALDAINLQLAIRERAQAVSLINVQSVNREAMQQVCDADYNERIKVVSNKAKAKPTKKIKKPNKTVNKRAYKKIEDSRAVWMDAKNKYVKKLDLTRTLKNIGLTENQLMKMKTKHGTLENSVKCSIKIKRTLERDGAENIK